MTAMGRSFKGRLLDILVLLALLAGLVSLHQNNRDMVKSLSHVAFDHYNKLFPRDMRAPFIFPENGIEGVVIVDIDEASLQRKGQFPWPRTVLAELIETLAAMEPKSIVFDMVFAEEDRTSPANIAAL